MKKNVFIRGLTTGLLLQLAIGPVFLFVMNTAFQNGLLNGISAATGVTAADYICIILAIMGAGKLMEAERIKRLLTVLSSAVIIIFGLIMIIKGINFSLMKSPESVSTGDVFKSFFSAFILTISSPLTIVFWTGVFTAKITEHSLDRRELIIFGLSAGSATFIFLGSCVICSSVIKVMFPFVIFQVLNIAVGVILTFYGIIRIFKIIKKGV